MKSISLYFLTLLLAITGYTQKKFNFKDLVGNKVSNKLGEVLTNYDNGSSISLIYFKNIKNEKKITVVSSNFRSKVTIDSFFLKTDINWLLKTTGSSFVLPIIQIMYDDETPRNKNSLNWDNNTFEQMADFKKMNTLPDSILLISPMIIYGSPPINKKVK